MNGGRPASLALMCSTWSPRHLIELGLEDLGYLRCEYTFFPVRAQLNQIERCSVRFMCEDSYKDLRWLDRSKRSVIP